MIPGTGLCVPKYLVPGTWYMFIFIFYPIPCTTAAAVFVVMLCFLSPPYLVLNSRNSDPWTQQSRRFSGSCLGF